MKKITYFVVVTFSVLLLLASCGKKSVSDSNCKLISIADVNSSGISLNYNITYNNEGKISTIQETGTNQQTESFTYNGNLAIINTSSNTGSAIDSVVLNSAGLVSSSISHDAFSDVSVVLYTYNSNNELLNSTFQYNNGPISTYTYSYTNGNLTSQTDGSQVSTYTYFTTKPFGNGDVLQVSQLINQGFLYVKNANLISGFTSGSTVESFTYTFDGTGKVTAVSAASGGSMETLTYQYSCN